MSFVSSNIPIPFTPLTIPGCVVWFDSADLTTISGSGTAAFQWRSKGATSLTASINAGVPVVAATCNSYPCIYFSNATTKLTTGTIPTLGTSGTTWITAATSLTPLASQADAGVVIASITPEKAIRWSNPGGGFMVYTIESSTPFGSTTANSNGVRGFTQTAAAGITVFQNGTSNNFSTSGNYSGGTNVSFSIGQWNTSGFVGWINEILVYNSVLTLAEYQQVEGYLAWKYGYNTFLPITHPNFSRAPPLRGQLLGIGPQNTQFRIPIQPKNTSFFNAFSPTQISGCVGWFDGKDPLGTGVIPSSGTIIRTWFDKSGQGNNANSNTATLPFYNSNGFVTFTGANFLALSNPNALVANTTFSIFVVEQRSNIQTSANYTYWLGGSSIVQNNNLQFGYRTSNAVTLGFFNNDVDFTGVPNPTANEQFRLWGAVWDGTNQTIFLYGSNTVQRAQATGIASWPNGAIGGYAGGTSNFYSGNLGEIIFFKPALSATSRQQVEGYLSYKWGIQSNLQSTHPATSNQSAILYSNLVIPLSRTIVMSGTNRWLPSQIAGLSLWLDAADSSTLFQNTAGTTPVTNGSQIQLWRDKSSNANNASNSQTVMTYNINGLNGFPTVSFPGTQITGFSLTASRLPNGASDASYFFVLNKNNSSTQVFFTHGGATQLKQFYAGGGLTIDRFNVSLISDNTSILNLNTIVSCTQTSLTGGVNGWRNGSAFSTTGATTTWNVDTTAAWLGSGSTVGSAFIYAGVISEVIVYNSALSTSQRQAVEGYLAWKWGLRANIPSTHPNKIVPVS
jgi:hypothetical protein